MTRSASPGDHAPRRGLRPVGGTPIEEAPLWVLGLLVVILWPIIFLALVGFLNGLRLFTGGGWTVAATAGVLSLLLVAGLGRQKRWKRPTPESPFAQVPIFARFSSWLWATLIAPNVLFGALVLSRHGEGLSYLSAWLIGLLVSAIHGGFALASLHRSSRARGVSRQDGGAGGLNGPEAIEEGLGDRVAPNCPDPPLLDQHAEGHGPGQTTESQRTKSEEGKAK